MKRILSVFLVMAMLLSVFTAAGITVSAAVPTTAKITAVLDDGTRDVNFNEGWQFFLATRSPSIAGGTGASGFAQYGLADPDGSPTTAQIIDMGYDDSAWRTLTVPHDFSIEGEKVAAGSSTAQAYLQGGLGWYRKTFTVPESMRDTGKRIMIDFEGVYQNSIVYLNGIAIGNYPSGYTGFSYDLTDRLNYGTADPNVLVVKVQNMSPSGRWYTGSGIVRPVHLIVTNPVRFVREGITLTTPNLKTTFKTNGSAELNVSASVFSNATNGVLKLKTSVIDAQGNTVATHEIPDTIEINPTTLGTLNDTVTVPNVKLWYPWNIGDAYMYTVRTQLYYEANGGDGSKLVDTVDTPFGFRWFHIDPTSAEDSTQGGLYVNDKYTKIQGVDLHHDSGSLGAVSYTDAYEHQFGILKSMGVNAYRTSHCPPSKQVIEVCSRLGFIVMEEAYDGWGAAKSTYDFGNFFMRPVPQDWAGLAPNGLSAVPTPVTNYSGALYTWSDWVIQQMVRRDINEPAVMMWSVGNEIRGCGTRPSWYDGTQYNPLGASTVSASTINEYTESVRLGRDVKAIDPNRLVAIGGDQQRTPPSLTATWGLVNQYLDGFGLNYNTATSVDVLMGRFTNTFFFESESSSQTSSRGVYLDPTIKNTGSNMVPGKRGGSNYDNDFASWTMSNEYGLKKDRDRKGFTGQFIWSGFDYLGEPTPYNIYPVGVSSFGCIDTAGFPKDSYFLYRSQWTDKTANPMVHLLPGNWNDWRNGENVEVWVNSNVRTAELFLNGVSLGTKSFDVKKTVYGKEYYETSELNPDDKAWPAAQNAGNTGGYASPGATIVSASGDSAIAEGSTYGKLHLTWQVPYAPGTLEVKAYTDATKSTLVATDKVVTAGTPYSVKMSPSKSVIKADGTSLSYVECTVVDEKGNVVPNANNLMKFDVTGGAIVGVDNGQQENAELYKWGNLERNTHSERTAYMGKVLVILQSNKGAVGNIALTASADNMKPALLNIAATADGTGTVPAPVTSTTAFASLEPVEVAVPVGVIPTLPSVVTVNFTDSVAGAYSLQKSVTWNAVTASDVAAIREFEVEGTVEGISEKVKATVYVANEEMIGQDKDIALNTALGNNNQTYSFNGLASESPLRAGALATASFCGSSSLYPNNMLNGSEGNAWGNTYSRGASVLLPAFSASRSAEFVEFFWDGTRVVKDISLSFTINASLAIPNTLKVQYWDGAKWVDAANQAVTKATESNQPTSITFAPVTTNRVRVDLQNATPYSNTGNMAIISAVINGWNINIDSLPELPRDPDVAYGVEVTSAAPYIINQDFALKVVTPTTVTKLKLFNENGLTVSLKNLTSTVEGNVRIWTANIAVGSEGKDRTFTMQMSGADNVYAEVGSFTVDILKGAAAPKVMSVIMPTNAKVNTAANYSITTNAEGSYSANVSSSSDSTAAYLGKSVISKTISGDGTCTWVLSIKVGTAGKPRHLYAFAGNVSGLKSAAYAFDVTIS